MKVYLQVTCPIFLPKYMNYNWNSMVWSKHELGFGNLIKRRTVGKLCKGRSREPKPLYSCTVCSVYRNLPIFDCAPHGVIKHNMKIQLLS